MPESENWKAGKRPSRVTNNFFRPRPNSRLKNDTVWLTHGHVAKMFQTTKQNNSLHLQNIFADNEQARVATVMEFFIGQTDVRTVNLKVEYYYLEATIFVGYRASKVRRNP